MTGRLADLLEVSAPRGAHLEPSGWDLLGRAFLVLVGCAAGISAIGLLLGDPDATVDPGTLVVGAAVAVWAGRSKVPSSVRRGWRRVRRESAPVVLVAVQIFPAESATEVDREAVRRFLRRERSLRSIEFRDGVGLLVSIEEIDAASALKRVADIYSRALETVSGAPAPPLRGVAGEIRRPGQRGKGSRSTLGPEAS